MVPTVQLPLYHSATPSAAHYVQQEPPALQQLTNNLSCVLKLHHYDVHSHLKPIPIQTEKYD